MNVTTISNFRKDAKKYFDQVIETHDILLITRTDGQTIVALPLDQYNALTRHLVLPSSSPPHSGESPPRARKDSS